MTNILTAISLNEDKERLIAYSLWLASRIEDKPHINMLCVSDYSLTPPAYLTSYLEVEKERNRAVLAEAAEQIRNSGVDASFTLASGRLIETFNTAIKELNAHYLVLGHKSHMIRQSSSEKMIKTLNIPMLVVRGDKADKFDIDKLSIKNILLLTDFSEYSLRAFELLQSLYKRDNQGIHVTVANVVSSIKIERLFSRIHGVSEEKKTHYCDVLLKEGRENLETLQSMNLSVDRVCRAGNPYRVINDIAIETEADIIFMGAKGIAGTEGVRIGSVTEAVIKSSPCPVFVVI